MGRVAGTTAADTRRRLVEAAAESFQSSGYEGTRVADIAAAAGVSNGAMYGHFGSKAELLVEALRDHGSGELARLFLDDPDRSVVDLLVALGRHLAEHGPAQGALVLEGLVAARRDGEVAAAMGAHLAERDAWLTDLVRAGQDEGTFDPSLSAEAVSRFCTMLLLGSLLLPAAGLGPVDADDWGALIDRIAASVRATPDRPDRRTP